MIVALLPVFSLFAFIPALIAIGLAIGGLLVSNRLRGSAAFGLSLGVLAALVALVVSVVSLYKLA